MYLHTEKKDSQRKTIVNAFKQKASYQLHTCKTNDYNQSMNSNDNQPYCII